MFRPQCRGMGAAITGTYVRVPHAILYMLNHLQDSVDFLENTVFVNWLFNVYAVSYMRIIITKMSYSGSNKAGDQTSFTLLVDSERKRVRWGFQPVLKRVDRVRSREIWPHPVRSYFHHKMPCWWISSPIRVKPDAFQSSLQCPRLIKATSQSKALNYEIVSKRRVTCPGAAIGIN